VRVRYFGDGPQNLERLSEVALAETREAVPIGRYAVSRVAPGRSGEVRMALEGVGEREAAEALRGRLVLGDPAFLEPLPPGQHYWFQLVGCRVFGDDGRFVGTVREVWATGAHDLLVVETESEQTVLLPTAEDLLQEVDVEAGRVVIELVPGLLDAGPRS
jgi:16S rRNA processing protein RimM